MSTATSSPITTADPTPRDPLTTSARGPVRRRTGSPEAQDRAARAPWRRHLLTLTWALLVATVGVPDSVPPHRWRHPAPDRRERHPPRLGIGHPSRRDPRRNRLGGSTGRGRRRRRRTRCRGDRRRHRVPLRRISLHRLARLEDSSECRVLVPLAWIMMAWPWPALAVTRRLPPGDAIVRGARPRRHTVRGRVRPDRVGCLPRPADGRPGSLGLAPSLTPSLPGVADIPLTNFAGWLLVSFLMYRRSRPPRPGRRTGRRRRPDRDLPVDLFLVGAGARRLLRSPDGRRRGRAAHGGGRSAAAGLGPAAQPFSRSRIRHGTREAPCALADLGRRATALGTALSLASLVLTIDNVLRYGGPPAGRSPRSSRCRC